MLRVKSFKSTKCCCGKVCKGLHGLKMHQRSCKVINDLEKMTELLIEQNENIIDSHTSPLSFSEKGINSQDHHRNGLQLTNFSNYPISTHHLGNNITTMTTVIYNHFKENFGYTNNINNAQYERKYESSSIKELPDFNLVSE